MKENKSNQEGQDSPPPFFGTWERLYKAILIIHVVLLTLFYFFFKHFS